MQKKQLAVVLASLLSISAAQAGALYDQEGTKLDIYGRISMGIAGGGSEFDNAGNKVNNGVELIDVYSRLGFRMSHVVTSDLSVFGRLEWRFRGDEQDATEAFTETRQSFVGLKSRRYGTVLAGNFDSLYYQFVSAPFDVYLDRGMWFNATGLQSRGDSIGYYTPELKGFTSFLQLKHYSQRGLTAEDQSSQGSEVAFQGGVRYQYGQFRVGLGAVDNVARVGVNGTDEILYGIIGAYDVMDQLTVRLGAETQNNSNTYGGGFDTVGLGGTYTSGSWAFNFDFYNIDRDNDSTSNAWATGAYYKVSSNFDVFAEVSYGDAPNVGRGATLGHLTDDVYWLTGARYHF